MEPTSLTRRTFLGLLPLPLVAGLPAEPPSPVRIVTADEPGRRFIMHGIIYGPDGRPAPNVRMFLYQTDATGWYTRPVNNPRAARLHGTVFSDAHGRYAFETIEPAHYADVDPAPPKHIHVHLAPPNMPDHWVDSFYFHGDPALRPTDLARAANAGLHSNIVHLAPTPASTPTTTTVALPLARRDFQLDPALALRNRVLNGSYRR